MNKKSDTVNSELRDKLFIVLAITGCISNIAGFTANAAIFGFTPQTLFCAACALIIIVSSLVGFLTGRTYVATIIILLVLGFVEFPILYISYGASTAVYMLVAEIGIITFMKPVHRVVMGAAVFVADIAAFVVRSRFPQLNMANDNMELDTLFSFIIAFIGIMVAVAIVIVQFERQAKQLSEMGEELTLAVNTDPLTEIRNRRYLMQYLEKQTAQMGDEKHCAVLIDLDLFKSVNDTYGHVFGDKVLKQFADTVKKNLGENDLIARFGGEEFMILFGTDNEEEIITTMDTISKEYAIFSEKEKGKEFTFSAGAALYGKNSSITDIFTTADKRLYKAKAAGRNMIVMD
jgi:diguanylate cyclase (GGDEF)-like protein